MKKILGALVIMLCVYNSAQALILAGAGPIGVFSDRRATINLNGNDLDVHDALGLSHRKYSYGLAGMIAYPDVALRAEWLPKTRERSTTITYEDKKEVQNELTFISGSTLLEFAWITPYRHYRIIPILSTDFSSTEFRLASTTDKKVNVIHAEDNNHAVMLGFYTDRGYNDIIYYLKAEFGVVGNAKTNLVDVGLRTLAYLEPVLLSCGYRYKDSSFRLNSLDCRIVERGFYLQAEVIF